MVRKTCDYSKKWRGAGEFKAKTCVEVTEKWNLDSQIKGLLFDITTSDTGLHKGACFRIEKALGIEMVWLACCQHVMKIVLSDDCLFVSVWSNRRSINCAIQAI